MTDMASPNLPAGTNLLVFVASLNSVELAILALAALFVVAFVAAVTTSWKRS